MVEFGVNILATDYWTPNNHLHVDRGRMLRPHDDADTLPGGVTTQGFVQVGSDAPNWTYLFNGSAGNINGVASPFTPGAGYQIVNFQPVGNVLQSAVSVAIKPPAAPAQTWRQEFINRLPTFRAGLRLMDLCATQSDYQKARDTAASGSWSGLRRRCPATYELPDGSGRYLWHSSNAWSIDELAALSQVVSEVMVCVPPLLLLPENLAELQAWLTTFSAQAGFTRIWVELSNEVWNTTLGNAPYANMVRDEAIRLRLAPGEHWLVGMAEYYTRQVMYLRGVCQGISPKLVPVLAWQSGDIWSFMQNPWNGNRPVNQYCYDSLNTIGHMFIAPYFSFPTVDEINMQLDIVSNWRLPTRIVGGNTILGANCDARGVTIHCYEAGQHWGANSGADAPSDQVKPGLLPLWDTYLRGLHERMEPQARCYLYGLAHTGPWTTGNCWGILEDIAVDNAKWTRIKETIEAIRLLAPVLP